MSKDKEGEESFGKKALRWIGYALAIGSFTTLLQSVTIYIFEDKAENFIMYVVDKNKSGSTRQEIADSLDINKIYVVPTLLNVIREHKQTKKNLDEFNETWIPYLEGEIKQQSTWRAVGYYVNLRTNDVEFHHWDGKDYHAWEDEGGWFYVKGGFKYYK